MFFKKLNSVFINLTIFGSGVSLISEYWNGSTWINLTLSNNSYNDGTLNLTQSGALTWESDSMTDWVKSFSPNLDTYEYYWIRLRTSTNPTIAPIVDSFARNGKYRIAVLSAPKANTATAVFAVLL